MKKYIKIITGKVTEEMAVKHLESLGGKIYNNLWKERGNKIIRVDDTNDIFYTFCNEQDLKENGREEIKLEEPIFELGEQVAASDTSEERAINDLNTDDVKYFYTGAKLSNGKYIVEIVYSNLSKWSGDYEYIAKIPPKIETIKITTSDGQEIEIEKDKAIELGFKIF